MADTFTTNLNLTKPEVGASTDTWGGKINTDLDTVDAIFSATGTAVHVKFASANFDDNAKAIFGTGDDLQIFHDGADSYVNSNGADLRLKADDVKIYNYAGTEVKAIFTTDGSVDLYHNNVKKFETSAAGATVTGTLVSDAIGIGSSSSSGSSNTKMVVTGTADNYIQLVSSTGNGGTLIGNAGGANLVFYTHTGALGSESFSERMRITSSGNVGIGTTSPHTTLVVNGGTFADIALQSSNSGTGSSQGGLVSIDTSNNLYLWNFENAPTIFGTNNAEKMRIASSGLSDLFSTTSTLRLRTSTTGTGGQMLSGFSGSTNNANGTQRLAIFANGNIQNTNNSYGSLSDQTLKENIVDATGKLDDLKKVKVRNFNFIGDDLKQIGVVAQELETVFPALVETIKDIDANGEQLDTENKSVKYSVFVPILIKAIQEQQTQIEALQSEINTLKGE
jgi:hypothetical protein